MTSALSMRPSGEGLQRPEGSELWMMRPPLTKAQWCYCSNIADRFSIELPQRHVWPCRNVCMPQWAFLLPKPWSPALAAELLFSGRPDMWYAFQNIPHITTSCDSAHVFLLVLNTFPLQLHSNQIQGPSSWETHERFIACCRLL